MTPEELAARIAQLQAPPVVRVCSECRAALPKRSNAVRCADCRAKQQAVAKVRKQREKQTRRNTVTVSPEFLCMYVGAKTGERCTAAPVHATSYCPRHSGTPDGKAARRRKKLAEDVVGHSLALLAGADVEERLTILKNAKPVDPGVLLLEEVARCAAVVHWLEDRIGEMSEESLMFEPELLSIRERKRAVSAGGESYTVRRTESRTTVSRYWSLLQEERKLLVRATEAALRSNIEERRIRLAERGVNVLEAAVSEGLLKLGLDPHNENVRAVMGAALRQALQANGGGSIFLGAADSPAVVPVESERVPEAEVIPPPPPAAF